MKPRYRRRELILAIERNTVEIASHRNTIRQLSKDIQAFNSIFGRIVNVLTDIDKCLTAEPSHDSADGAVRDAL